MEQKLNIAEILKNKPVGLKLYSSTFGYIKFNGIQLFRRGKGEFKVDASYYSSTIITI